MQKAKQDILHWWQYLDASTVCQQFRDEAAVALPLATPTIEGESVTCGMDGSAPTSLCHTMCQVTAKGH